MSLVTMIDVIGVGSYGFSPSIIKKAEVSGMQVLVQMLKEEEFGLEDFDVEEMSELWPSRQGHFRARVENLYGIIAFKILTTSKRLADRKVERFEKNIKKRGSVPETTTKKKDSYPVGPIVLGFFIFVVIGSYNPYRNKWRHGLNGEAWTIHP
ncbi:hypothetical protein CTI12_AA510460 [Artemisia annua]|uniref:Uncharacterized protein n=1 Tax=Artemisia annua TaxID=35608 RepID=A0A2U1L9T1_ARTAN|nr:hypothetical protein CTI12_AA510460 [Artemisia annua]